MRNGAGVGGDRSTRLARLSVAETPCSIGRGTDGGGSIALIDRLRQVGGTAGVEVGIAVSARIIILEREITNSSVFRATLIFEKRGITKRVVAEAVAVVKQRSNAESTVGICARIAHLPVKEKRICTDRRVPGASGVEQHRCSANCGI